MYMEKFLSLPFSIFHFSKSIEKLKVHIVLWYILFFLFPGKIYIILFPYLIIAFSSLVLLRYMWYMVFTFYNVFLILRKVIYLAGTDWTMTILLFRSKYALLIDIFYYYIWFVCFCGSFLFVYIKRESQNNSILTIKCNLNIYFYINKKHVLIQIKIKYK